MRWDRCPGRTVQRAAPESSEGARTPEQERQGTPRGQRWPPTRGHRWVTRRGFRHRPRGFAQGRAVCRAMGPAARGSFVVGCPPNIAARTPKRAEEKRGCLRRGSGQPKRHPSGSQRGNQGARTEPLRSPQKATALFPLRSLCDLDVLALSVVRAPRTARNAPEITPRRPEGPQEGPKKRPCQPKRGLEQPERARRRPKRDP